MHPTTQMPQPEPTGIFTTPILKPLRTVGATRAGILLNQGRTHTPRHAHRRGGRILVERAEVFSTMGVGATILPAGQWWCALARDGSAVFLDSHPDKSGRTIKVAPVVLRLASVLTRAGITRKIRVYDACDAMENPDLPMDFATALRDGLAQELQSWGEICTNAPQVADTVPAPAGMMPPWFSPLHTHTPEDVAQLRQFCDGLALLGSSTPGRSGIKILGATLDSAGRQRPASITAGPGFPKDLLAQAQKAITSPQFFWPPERQIAQAYANPSGKACMRAAVVASATPDTAAPSHHHTLQLAHLAQQAMQAAGRGGLVAKPTGKD